MAPDFLTLADILAIHRDQIARYGGIEGVRDAGLLDSAVAMPRATFDGAYLHADLFELAAALLFHLTCNHPFMDGNKRVGAAAALVFLELNGQRVVASQEDLAELVLAVARGKCDKQEIAAFLREHSQHVDPDDEA